MMWPPELWDYVKNELAKSETHTCTYLGEVERYYHPETAYDGKFRNGKGHFYLFTRKLMPIDVYHNPLPQLIKPSTFNAMNGIYASTQLQKHSIP